MGNNIWWTPCILLYLAPAILSALNRTALLIAGQHAAERTFWQCFSASFNIGWIVLMPLSALMLVVVSADRLLAVSAPLYYFKLRARYAKWLIGTAYGFCGFVALVTYGFGIWKRNQDVYISAPCYFGNVMLLAVPIY